MSKFSQIASRTAVLALFALAPFSSAHADDSTPDATPTTAATPLTDGATLAPTGPTITGNLPLCTTMLTNCIVFAQRALEAAGPGGTIPNNITEHACRSMARQAQHTGTWPDNQPFGFAMACETSAEPRHHRHHTFRADNGDGGAKPIADPAQTPATPPVASNPPDQTTQTTN